MADTDLTPRVSERSLLRRDRDFARLWLGESVSAVGSQITLLAVPLVAVQLLEATPGQMGILGALGTVPYLLFAVVAGVWVDRSRKRPLLIGAHLGEAVLLLLIPALALLDVLRLGHLFAIAFGLGIGKVLFEVAYQSYLPQARPPGRPGPGQQPAERQHLGGRDRRTGTRRSAGQRRALPRSPWWSTPSPSESPRWP